MPLRIGASLLFCLLTVAFAGAADVDRELTSLYQTQKLFQREAFAEVRGVFSRRFEKSHADRIRYAFGPDHQALNAWLNEHREIKETFYTAIDEKRDNVLNALIYFKELWKRDPEKLAHWPELAIAVAVTWDNDRGIYDYERHQTRVGATLPEGMVGGIENYEYVIAFEKSMPQPVALYPWEFLLFVVNHRTPLAEREWAVKYFEQIRGKSKSWHKDVPFDWNIVKLEQDNDDKARPSLTGRPYTLANVRKFGGVCAHQTDFACRLAQSVGCPAMYVSGESAHRGSHAWWTYVNVSGTKKDELKFLFVADGRTEGFVKDLFYTGMVIDPQSGERLLDRDVERRLWVTGSDTVGKRLSQLIMRGYPVLNAELALSTPDKMAYLDKCLKVSRYNEEAWLQFAALAKAGELGGAQKRVAQARLESLLTTFAPYPDFAWRVLDDLTQVSETLAEKAKLLEQALNAFDKGGRPDLTCAARLKVAQVQTEDQKPLLAYNGLLLTIKRYPTEGRYIPKLLQEAETLAPRVKGGVAQIAQLYCDLLPDMIAYYKSDADEYCKKIEEQARQFMMEHQLQPAAATLDAGLAKARAALKVKRN